MAKEQNNKPVKEFRIGAIKGAVWKREHEGKTFYNLSLFRSFRVESVDANDDGWRENASFDLSDLGTVKLICEMGDKWIKQEILAQV
jgi:hypothetical protein